MKLPEQYIEEKKIQLWVIPVFSLFAVIGVIYFQDQRADILYANFMCYISFLLFHIFYLGIKYSFAHLSTGIYSKEHNPEKYYLSLCFFVIGGSWCIYLAINN